MEIRMIGGIEIRTIGGLNTSLEWEDLLQRLPDPARGAEGLGKFWEREDPPRAAGNDPIVKQGWRLAIVRGVELRLPEDAEVVSVRNEMVGEYQFVRVHGVNVHLRDGLKFVDGRVVGDAHVCVKVTWPKGAELRQSADKPAWRNYFLSLDFHPTKEEATHAFRVLPAGAPRKPLLMFGLCEEVDDWEFGEVQTVCYATRSANWRPPRGSKQGMGCDQCLCFYKVK